MPTRQVRQVQDDFGAGSFLSVAPELIPENGVYKIENGLLNIDGTSYKRGGVTYKSNAALGTAPCIGLWDGYLGSTRYTFYAASNHFGKLDVDDATPVSLGSSGLSSPVPMVAFKDKLYIGGGKTFDGTTIATLGANFQSGFYAVCQNRLVWAIAPNKIRYSEIDDPTTFTNSLGTSNEHTLPDGVQIIGLATVGANLLIFTTKGTWILSGLALDIVDQAGTPQHRLQPYATDLVLWDQTGIASWESLLLVPATNGVFLVDGISAPVRLSQSIDPYYRDYVEGPYHAGQAVVYNSHYFVPVVRDSLNSTVEVMVCRLDRSALDRRRRTTFGWTFFAGTGAAIGAFAVRNIANAPRQPVLLGVETVSTARLVNCSSYFTPDAYYKTDADGSVPHYYMILRDEILNGLGEGVVRSLRANYILLDAQADNPVIALDEGEGAEGQTIGPRWGDPAGLWGTGFGPATDPTTGSHLWPYSSTDSQQWNTVLDGTVADTAPEDNGTTPYSWRLKGRSRKRRFRLRQETPTSNFTLKSLELFVRPSADIRRAR